MIFIPLLILLPSSELLAAFYVLLHLKKEEMDVLVILILGCPILIRFFAYPYILTSPTPPVMRFSIG